MASERPVPARPGRARWIIGLAVVAGLGYYGFSAFNQSLARYTHDFTEVQRRTGELLQVPGVVAKSSPQAYDTQDGTFSFTMLDVQTRTHKLQVRSHRVKPGNFDEATQVVCVGTYGNGTFEARDILVKCPSKEQDKLRASEAGSAK